jgi:predicted RNase H-like HicB family nuclease
MKNIETKEYNVALLTAKIYKDGNTLQPYCGVINEVKGCIAQAKTEKECKQQLLELYYIKKEAEYKYIHK